jgi:DNA-binding MarR family transcriptional regulator
MQVVQRKFQRLIRAIAPSGNLFLVLTVTELRRQGITFLGFYVLQRCIEELEISAYTLRCETGLPDYEVSRACRFLAKSGLVEIAKSARDARVRVLKSTDRGRRVHDQVLLAAAKQFEIGAPAAGRLRRLSEAAQLFQKGNRVLLGGLQLSLFDVDLFDQDIRPSGRRRTPAKCRSRSKRSEP